ncbi:hypothetical protein [Bacillus sp. Marseille-Q3570]|uniref:hypothetical protein n=1 Tax=Bacillus sp. Marseille-Q3570 TaxID=2963522 RepID=UPI0021B77122|nr:hypothetical protein [Bacillus sp. Marseille-Q3570]
MNELRLKNQNQILFGANFKFMGENLKNIGAILKFIGANFKIIVIKPKYIVDFPIVTHNLQPIFGKLGVESA